MTTSPIAAPLRRTLRVVAALALLIPASGFSANASADGNTPTAASAASVDSTPRKAKAPRGMSDMRLRTLIERSFRMYSSVRECDSDPNCTMTFKWTKLQWRGSARHCIAGQNYGKCERWATAYIARTNLLVTETENPDYWGKVKKSVTQYGYWSNGLKRVSFTDGYGTKEAWCEPVIGCGKTLLVWQDEFKDWFYSFSNIGDCCSAIRLT